MICAMAPIGRDELEILYAAGTRLRLAFVQTSRLIGQTIQFASNKMGWDRIGSDGYIWIYGTNSAL